MINAKWIAIPVLAAAFALGGEAQAGSIKTSDNVATAEDFSAKKGGGKGHAKGHKAHKSFAYRSRGANNPYFCPPGQAKKPGLGSAHRC